MSEPSTTVPFPSADQPETSYTAKSGGIVRLRYLGVNAAEVRLDGEPSYLARLIRDGGSFHLEPAPGVPAVGGINIDEADLIEYF